MSDTERAAIESGTVWWDAELFSGKPDWQRLLQAAPASLSAEEQAFLDNEVETLCDIANDWETTQVWQDMSPEGWQYTKDAGFLGMIIPKQYGGKGFSHYAHSQVVMKLSTRCSAAAISVMVPNSSAQPNCCCTTAPMPSAITTCRVWRGAKTSRALP